MLIFKTEAKNIRQAVKAFNRMEPSGAMRDRPHDILPLGSSKRYGRKFARIKTPEETYKELIAADIVRITRRRGKYPLVEVKWRDEWVSLEAFQKAEPSSPDDDAPIEIKTL